MIFPKFKIVKQENWYTIKIRKCLFFYSDIGNFETFNDAYKALIMIS